MVAIGLLVLMRLIADLGPKAGRRGARASDQCETNCETNRPYDVSVHQQYEYGAWASRVQGSAAEWPIDEPDGKLKDALLGKTFGIAFAFAAMAAAQEPPVPATTTATAAVAEVEGVRVVSALGEDSARQAVEGLLVARDRLAAIGAELRSPELPVHAIVLGSTLDLAPFLTTPSAVSRTRALSLPAQDRNYILLAWTAPGDPVVALEHELIHLADPDPDSPMWVREGRAEATALRGRSPRRHLYRLDASPWLPFVVWRFAGRGSRAFGDIVFYAQSWLAVEWLATRGVDRMRVTDADMTAAVDELGVAGVEAALFDFYLEVKARHSEEAEEAEGAEPSPEETADAEVSVRPAPDWEIEFALADVERALGRTNAASTRLERLDSEAKATPEYARTLGAIEMDLGRYAHAEELLTRAVAVDRPEARTRYRYALMLLRPTEDGDATARAEEARRQARFALDEAPGASAYRLTLAQAETTLGRWTEAVSTLRPLLSDPEYAARAQREYETIGLRRQQALRAVEAPQVAAEAAKAGEVPRAPLPKTVAKPPPPRKPSWPPPGTTVVAGRIDFIDCSGPQKVVILRSPFFPMRFREPEGRPARLYSPPIRKWKTAPCEGAAGMYVNIAYRPIAQPNYVQGELVAILF